MSATLDPFGSPAVIDITVSPSIMDRLRAETAEQHRLAESSAWQRSMLRGVVTPPMLARWFAQLLPVHRTLEDYLPAHRAQSDLFAVFEDDQRREPDLAADIGMLDPDMPQQSPLVATTQCLQALMAMTHDDQAESLLGVLYVFEGSNNGGKYIARALLRAWGWPEERCPRYLNPYGDAQTARWQRFKSAMNALPLQPAQEQAIIDGAKAAFTAIHAMSEAMAELQSGTRPVPSNPYLEKVH